MSPNGDVTLPVLPDRPVRLQRLRKPAVSEKALAGFARRFELAGSEKAGSFQRDQDVLRYTEGPYAVQLHRASGGLRYYDTARWQVDDGESNVELSDRSAVGVAEKFVARTGLAEGEEHRLLRVARLNVAVAEGETGRAEERVVDVGVCFQRLVDGIPVDGPGGKIAVYVDHERRVTGCERIWRAIAGPGPEVELRPPEWVLDRLRRKYGDRDGSMEIEEFRFGYLGFDWNAAQTVLQPAYVVLLTRTGGDPPVRIRKAEVLPAAVKPRPGLVPPRKRPVKQPTRG